MKTLIFLFSVLISYQVFAQQVSDPNGLLAQSDQFLGASTFSKNFVQGTKYTMSFKDCSFCRAETFVHYTVDSVRIDDQGTSVATITDGSNEKMTVPENFWKSISGNMIRGVIYHVSQSGFQFTILDAHAGHMDIKMDGQVKSVDTFTVHATAKNQIGMSLDESMTITRDLGGYAQLITWTEKQPLGTVYTRTMTEYSH